LQVPIVSKLLQFKSRPHVDDEASVWIARLDRGLSSTERADLDAWLAADVRNGRSLIDLARLWDAMDLLRELSGLLELPIREPSADAPSRWPRVRAAWAVRAVAFAVAAVALGVTWWRTELPVPVPTVAKPAAPRLPTRPVARVAEPAGTRFETRLGERRTEALPDGSIVQLNTASRVTVRYAPSRRQVEIDRGEAHFDVTPDPRRPFVVRAAGREIRAVGTAFNVRVDQNGRLQVTVTEGRIAVRAAAIEPAVASDVGSQRAAGSGPVGHNPVREDQIDAGQRLTMLGGQWEVEALQPDVLSSQLAWQRGMLIFDGEPLDAALAEVSRYADVRFEIGDPSLRRLRIGGFFKSGDIEGLVRSLEQNLQIVATRAADGSIRLTARSPGTEDVSTRAEAAPMESPGAAASAQGAAARSHR
jgi:transmembrane sensor